LDQVRESARALEGGAPSFVSVFAGRIADTGRDPIPFMSEALEILRSDPAMQLIWASPREVLNIVQAECIGCHIITATPDILAKLPLLGRDLSAYSLETVRMFYNDAARSGFEL
jgi:transaldolase